MILTTVEFTLVFGRGDNFYSHIFAAAMLFAPAFCRCEPIIRLVLDNSDVFDDFHLLWGAIPRWHAVRIFYNRIEPVRQTLDEAAIRYFYPMHLVEKSSDGGLNYVQEPLIKSLIFVRSSLKTLDEIRFKHLGSVAPYYDHLTLKPITIPDEQMDPFMRLCSIKDSGLEYLGEDGPQFHKGDRVRVTDGLFKGYEGHIKRIKHDRRLIVAIEGVAAFATKFIPPSFLEKIEE